MAFNRAEQGRLFRQLEQYDQAAHELIGALGLYRELDLQSEIAAALNQLGELARIRGNPAAAIPLLNEAVAIAEAAGDVNAGMFYRTNLGGALVNAGDVEAGLSKLMSVIKQAKDVSRVVNWMGLPKTQRFLACGYLRQQDPDAALTAVLKAIPSTGKTKGRGASWRVLGTVAAQLPPDALPIMVDGQPYDAPACFAESLRILREHSGSVTKREQVLTLRAWGAYLQQQGDAKQGQSLINEAQALADMLGLEGA
jgi:tetratricopeptide (TPR) repeat protein